MSRFEAVEPICQQRRGRIANRIYPVEKDLGGFTIRRVLPAGERRKVGPFVFFDHIGPSTFPPGKGIQVRPHPHIGLATVTYLFEGEIMHRDSLGSVQKITPGAVNLMTAGRGIVHSERASHDPKSTSKLHGIQAWLALPEGQEECEPWFRHYTEEDVPEFTLDKSRVRVVMGGYYDVFSPVATHSHTLFLDCHMQESSWLDIPVGSREIAVYVISGEVAMGGLSYTGAQMVVIGREHHILLDAVEASHIVVIGGEPMPPRYVWWNFVSSSHDRIKQAAKDWKEGRFGKVPGDDEFIPLPE